MFGSGPDPVSVTSVGVALYLALDKVRTDLLLDLCVELVVLTLFLVAGTQRASWLLQLTHVVLLQYCPV